VEDAHRARGDAEREFRGELAIGDAAYPIRPEETGRH
jgi:hypothetical protein